MEDHTTQEIPYGYCHCGCGQKTRIITKNHTGRGYVIGEPYQFVTRHGSRAYHQRIGYATLEDILWRHAARGAPDDCWEWQASTLPRGYGQLTYRGKGYLAHRVSYEVHKGPIPKGMFVCHSCDNPRCINPAHLWLGTHQENVADMWQKGRGMIGEIVPKAILSDVDAIRIRQLAQDGATIRSTAEEYGVDYEVIRMIVRRKTYAHLP